LFVNSKGDLDITDVVTIKGASQSGTIVQAGTSAYGGIDRIFEVWFTRADIQDMTVKNGQAKEIGGTFGLDLGGAIRNSSGNLLLKGLKVADSFAACTGRGIYNWRSGLLTLENSTVSDNKTELVRNFCNQHGGGLASEASSLMNIIGSTIKNNSSMFGGGVDSTNNSQFVLANSTLGGNSATIADGGIRASGAPSGAPLSHLTNLTVADNSAPRGGGVKVDSGNVSAKNTIIADSPSGNDCDGPIASQGYNLSSDNTCFSSSPSPTDLVLTDPKLGPLQDNGGPTETRALLEGSPAVDTGNGTNAPTTDQRGISRPQDGDGDGSALHDIGAFEKEATDDAAVPTTKAYRSVEPNDQGWNKEDVTVTLKAQDDDGGSGVNNVSFSAIGAHQEEATVDGDTAVIKITEEGETRITFFATDNSNNVEVAKEIAVKLDKTKPTISIASPKGSYTLKQANVVATYKCTDETNGSRVASCTGDLSDGASIDTSVVGPKSFKVSATDKAGNQFEQVSDYQVVYAWSGVLQPFNGGKTDNDTSDDDSLFKLGSTVPVKFQLTGDSASVTDATPKLYITKVTAKIQGTEPETTVTAAADTGSTFRYDPESNQYILNLSTKGTVPGTQDSWTTGTYQLRVDLGDGAEHTGNISLR
jgi:hypothetical protein